MEHNTKEESLEHIALKMTSSLDLHEVLTSIFKDGLVHTVNDEFFWRKDGTSLPVEYTSTPLRDKDDNLVGAVVTFRDITQRKQAEKALRDALGEVEQLKDQLQVENTYLQVERQHILAMLEKTNWRIEGSKGAALPLGLNPNTLRSRMQRLGIRKPPQAG